MLGGGAIREKMLSQPQTLYTYKQLENDNTFNDTFRLPAVHVDKHAQTTQWVGRRRGGRALLSFVASLPLVLYLRNPLTHTTQDTSSLVLVLALALSTHPHACSIHTQTRFLAPPTKRHYNTIKLKANGTFLRLSIITTPRDIP